MNNRLAVYLEDLRMGLAGAHVGPRMVAMGVIGGTLSAGMIIVFRLLSEGTLSLFLGADTEHFEGLSTLPRFALPVVGALAIGVIFHLSGATRMRFGLTHVMERVACQEGHLPVKELVMQFVGGILCLISGHSVGREGPGIHLGAGISSILGQRLALPNNSIRTLVACGTAAGIAASFNTPLAGVIFAMEVVMMEYTIAGFIPVILAAVLATAMSRAVFGAEPVFIAPIVGSVSIGELPFLIVVGLLIGALAALFIVSLCRLIRYTREWLYLARVGLAGLLIGIIGIFVPEILGIGYDTVNQALAGELALNVLLGIALMKLLGTVLCLGLGLPGGFIGPILVLGAVAGGALGYLGVGLPGVGSTVGFYAMLGMGAMMGAVLQAPLAALVALLELTANHNIIMPGMLTIVTATIAAREIFGTESIITHLLRDADLVIRNDPLTQMLRRVGVAAVMNRSFVRTTNKVTLDEAKQLLEPGPQWIIITHEPFDLLLPAVALAHYLSEGVGDDVESRDHDDEDHDLINLMEIPAQRLQLAPVHLQATLQEALGILETESSDALYVVRQHAPLIDRVFGIVLRQDIESYYRPAG